MSRFRRVSSDNLVLTVFRAMPLRFLERRLLRSRGSDDVSSAASPVAGATLVAAKICSVDSPWWFHTPPTQRPKRLLGVVEYYLLGLGPASLLDG